MSRKLIGERIVYDFFSEAMMPILTKFHSIYIVLFLTRHGLACCDCIMVYFFLFDVGSEISKLTTAESYQEGGASNSHSVTLRSLRVHALTIILCKV